MYKKPLSASATRSLHAKFFFGPVCPKPVIDAVLTERDQYRHPCPEIQDAWRRSVGGQYKASIDYVVHIEIQSGAIYIRGPEVRTTTIRSSLSEMPRTVEELHRLCVETAGVDQEARLRPDRPGDLRHSVLDSSRAARELDWRPGTTLADGLVKTWHA